MQRQLITLTNARCTCKVWHTTKRQHDNYKKMFYFEWQVLEILLDRGVSPGAADQPLGIEHGVLGVRGQLVLGGVADETLSLAGEGHVGRRDAVSLVVGDDFHTAVLENADTKNKNKRKRWMLKKKCNSSDLLRIFFFSLP